ncbi:MAG: head GIN domain-containing protein [bacterium]
MNRIVIGVVVFLVVGLFVGSIVLAFVYFNTDIGFTRDSVDIITKDREVEGFTVISLEGIGNLRIVQSEEEGISIVADEKLMDDIITEVKGETLEIKYRTNWLNWVRIFWNRNNIAYTVKAKDIKAVELSGSSKLSSNNLTGDELDIRISGSGEVDLDVNYNKMSCEVSGSGHFNVQGKADEQNIQISGSGKYFGQYLISKNADVKISGSGEVELQVSDQLDVEISGSGKVSYLGDPKIKQTISGSGDINKISE